MLNFVKISSYTYLVNLNLKVNFTSKFSQSPQLREKPKEEYAEGKIRKLF